MNAYAALNDGKVISGEDQYVEIVGAAESFVGAQTTIHYNADTHTINGTEYNDAYKFFRDDAGVTEDYNFTWYLDQYGNVIGATGITSNYAVLKDIIWIQGTPGYAQATLVYMDGTEATVTVDSIDEFNLPVIPGPVTTTKVPTPPPDCLMATLISAWSPPTPA